MKKKYLGMINITFRQQILLKEEMGKFNQRAACSGFHLTDYVLCKPSSVCLLFLLSLYLKTYFCV